METLFHANSPFTVTGENEVGVDLVLTQPFLLYHVNHVVLILTTVNYFLSKISIRGETFVSKQVTTETKMVAAWSTFLRATCTTYSKYRFLLPGKVLHYGSSCE